MTANSSNDNGDDPGPRNERGLLIRYGALTFFLFLPLLIAFAFVRNLYPIAASTMMMAGGNLERGRTYYVLRGETSSGEIIDLPPMDLTNALSGRTWSLVAATIENRNFTNSKPHPANLALIASAGGVDKVPPAARLNELLRAWGNIHNSRLSPSSPQYLRAVRLEAFRWDGGNYSNYDRHLQTWRVEL